MQLTDKENEKIIQTARDSEKRTEETQVAQKAKLNRRDRRLRRLVGFKTGQFAKGLAEHYAEQRLARTHKDENPPGTLEHTVTRNLSNRAKRRRQAAA